MFIDKFSLKPAGSGVDLRGVDHAADRFVDVVKWHFGDNPLSTRVSVDLPENRRIEAKARSKNILFPGFEIHQNM